MNPNKRRRLAQERSQAGRDALDAGHYSQAADDYLEAAQLWKGLKGQELRHAACLGNAAQALIESGRYARAKDLLEKTLALQKKILGLEHPNVADSLNNLASVYARQGNYEEAKQLYEKALAIKEKTLGHEHPDVTGSLNNLGNIYNIQGNYEQARQLHEKALAIREKTLGHEHPDVADSLNNLGNIYSTQGNYEKAKQLYEKALAIKEKTLGHEHPGVAANLNNLANIYKTQGNYEEAKQLYEKALVIREKILGHGHPEVAASLNNLATVYARQGNYEEAKQLCEKALAIKEKTLGHEHPEVATSLNNLANIYNTQGELEKAKDLYQRAQTIINKVFDENHPTAQMISQNYLELFNKVEVLKHREVEQRIALEEAKKLSYLGNMATGVAHNINNPVGIIRLAAQRGLRRLEKGLSLEEGQEIFQRILTQANRLHTIIQNFENFAQGDRQHREVVALNALVEQTQDHFKSQLEAHHITLKLDLSDQNPCSQANHFVLQEVLINLISNAREALEQTPEALIFIKTWQEAEKVGLQIEDNGPGVPPEQQKHLFSPFHSTKAHGTGLGLHFAYKALVEIDGTLIYHNRNPHGACFSIELPPANGATV